MTFVYSLYYTRKWTQTDQRTVITSFYSVVSIVCQYFSVLQLLHWFEGQDQMQWVIIKTRIFMIAYYLGKFSGNLNYSCSTNYVQNEYKPFRTVTVSYSKYANCCMWDVCHDNII